MLCSAGMQFSRQVGRFPYYKDGCLIFVRQGDFQLQYGTRMNGLSGSTFRINERAPPRPFPHPSNEAASKEADVARRPRNEMI